MYGAAKSTQFLPGGLPLGTHRRIQWHEWAVAHDEARLTLVTRRKSGHSYCCMPVSLTRPPWMNCDGILLGITVQELNKIAALGSDAQAWDPPFLPFLPPSHFSKTCNSLLIVALL